MAEYVTTNEQSSDITPGKRYYTRPYIGDGLWKSDLRYIELDDGSTVVIRLSGCAFIDCKPWEVRDDGTGDTRRMTDMDMMTEMFNRSGTRFDAEYGYLRVFDSSERELFDLDFHSDGSFEGIDHYNIS